MFVANVRLQCDAHLNVLKRSLALLLSDLALYYINESTSIGVSGFKGVFYGLRDVVVKIAWSFTFLREFDLKKCLCKTKKNTS